MSGKILELRKKNVKIIAISIIMYIKIIIDVYECMIVIDLIKMEHSS